MNSIGTISGQRRSQPSPARLAEELRPRLTILALLLRRETSGELPVSVVQGQVLLRLAAEGPQRVTELAREQGISQPSATVLVDRLERHGWVERGADPSDRRAQRVALTPAGRSVLAQAAAVRTERLAGRLAALDAPERRAIEAALPAFDRLSQSWQEDLQRRARECP
ncbi:MAG: MarR family winged helix-turn-helix transcriptional regulator, partial [Candidatus Dormibacteria bacterium]